MTGRSARPTFFRRADPVAGAKRSAGEHPLAAGHAGEPRFLLDDHAPALFFSRSIRSPELGFGQMELAAGIGWETESQAGLILKSDLDVEVDLMLAPFR